MAVRNHGFRPTATVSRQSISVYLFNRIFYARYSRIITVKIGNHVRLELILIVKRVAGDKAVQSFVNAERSYPYVRHVKNEKAPDTDAFRLDMYRI